MYISLYGFIFLSIIWHFIWYIWIRKYLILKGEHPGFFFSGLTPTSDFNIARRISKRDGYSPWFLKIGIIVGVVAILLLVVFFLIIVTAAL
jgi:hypothetical protein